MMRRLLLSLTIPALFALATVAHAQSVPGGYGPGPAPPAVGNISGLGPGVATLLGGASSGTGGPAGKTSPTFTTPNIGVATGTSLAASGTLTVGTTLQSYPLYVATASAPDILILDASALATNTRATIDFWPNGHHWELGARGSAANVANGFYIYDDFNTTLRLVIDSSGQLGLGGISAPGAQLDANGNIRTTAQLISTVATGTAPLAVSSTTNVANLNASSLSGATFANPGAIGGGTPAAGTFTTLNSTTLVATGSAPTNSGSCAINTQVGGSIAGSFKANGSCAAGTLVLSMPTAPTGWACNVQDMTTPADLIKQSAYTTASATFAATTMAASDQEVFQCTGF